MKIASQEEEEAGLMAAAVDLAVDHVGVVPEEAAEKEVEERKWKRHDTDMIDEVVAQAPVFVSKIKDVNVHEGQPAHFDCRIEPIGDGSMQVKLSIYA